MLLTCGKVIQRYKSIDRTHLGSKSVFLHGRVDVSIMLLSCRWPPRRQLADPPTPDGPHRKATAKLILAANGQSAEQAAPQGGFFCCPKAGGRARRFSGVILAADNG